MTRWSASNPRPGGSATRRRSGWRYSTSPRSLLWGAAIWTVRPDWLALATLRSGSAPPRQPGAARRPQGRRPRAQAVPLEPQLRLARLPRHAGRRPVRSLGRAAHAFPRRRPPNRRIRSSSAASPPERPPPTRSTSASARRASRCGSASSKASAAPKARRSAFGCSSASARRPSHRPTCRMRRSGVLVERCLAMAREAPEDPYAGLAPPELACSAAICPRSTAATASSPIRRSFAPARWRPSKPRSPSPASPIRAAPGRALRGRRSRSRPRAGFRALIGRPATAARPA